MPRQLTCPASGSSTPRAIRIVVVLPDPLAPEEAEHLPRGDLEREVVEGDDRSEPLVQMVDDERHALTGAVNVVIRPGA